MPSLRSSANGDSAKVAAEVLRKNRLLACLTDKTLVHLAADFEVIASKRRKMLFDAHSHMPFALFPLDGVISLTAVMEDGGSIETAAVGREGFAGLNLLFGSNMSSVRAVPLMDCQLAALRASIFRTSVRQYDDFSRTLFGYAAVFLSQLSQAAACNRLHSLNERCARWLLTVDDRTSQTFPITHEFLAKLLGVRRATVTVAAGSLQSEGLIRYSRGQVTVLDRGGLESAACECYRAGKNSYERLLGAEQ